MLRATPTGISAVIDAPRQRRRSRCRGAQPGVIDAVLPPAANSPPLFARFGNIIPLLLGFVLIFGGIVLGRRRR